jgi:hypothetical protein
MIADSRIPDQSGILPDDWRRNPDVHLHMTVHGDWSIGMLATRVGRPDILRRWLDEGGDGHRTMRIRAMPPHVASIGSVAVDVIMRSHPESDLFQDCLDAWLAWGGDPYAHGDRGRCTPDLVHTAALCPHPGPLRSLLNAGAHPLRHGSLDAMWTQSIFVRDATIHANTRPDGYWQSGKTMSMGEIMAGIPARSSDHGLLVMHALLRLMGYAIPDHDPRWEADAMRSPIGRRMAHEMMIHITDPMIMAIWISRYLP